MKENDFFMITYIEIKWNINKLGTRESALNGIQEHYADGGIDRARVDV